MGLSIFYKPQVKNFYSFKNKSVQLLEVNYLFQQAAPLSNTLSVLHSRDLSFSIFAVTKRKMSQDKNAGLMGLVVGVVF